MQTHRRRTQDATLLQEAGPAIKRSTRIRSIETVGEDSTEEMGALQDAIRTLHGCESAWVEAVAINETFLSQRIWVTDVHIFDLIDFPAAPKAYTWSYDLPGDQRRRVTVVLHTSPSDSPRAAVRAGLALEERRGRSVPKTQHPVPMEPVTVGAL